LFHALLATAVLLVGFSSHAAAAPDQAIRYAYDDAGRLKAVSDPASDTATYTWDSVGNLLSIRRVGSLSLSVIQASPGRGEVGTSVTVYGTGFRATVGDNSVKFNGTPGPVMSASRTEIVAKVPAGATTGPVSVTTPDGTATSAENFVVTQPNRPVVTSISPTIVNRGDLVTVTGSNFGERTTNMAAVNQTRVSVEAETATSLSIRVPDIHVSGRVSVTSLEGTGVGPDLFVAPRFDVANEVGVTGRLAVGDTRTFTMPAGKNEVVYVFDATAGQRVAWTYSPSPNFVHIYAPDGSTVEAPSSSEPIDIPTTGTYTVNIDANPGTTGTFRTFEVPPDQERTIVPSHAGAAETLSFTIPRQNARLRFEGRAGQRISFQGTGVSGGTYFVDIRKADGSVVGPTFPMGGSGANFQDAVELPVDGQYWIRIDPVNETTGSITVTTWDATSMTGALPPTTAGTTQDVALATPGRNARFTFEGTAGDLVSLRVLQNTYIQPRVRIHNPDGTTLAIAVPAATGFIDSTALQATGTHTIEVDPNAATTGSLRLVAYSVPPEDAGMVVPTQSGVTRTLDLSTPGQNAKLSFAGQAGQAISVRGAQGGVRSRVSIVKPDGTRLSGRNQLFDPASTTNLYDAEALPEDGSYAVLIDPEGEASGSITVTVHDATEASRAITPTPEGTLETLALPAPGQNGRLTFTGTEGQRVSVKATSTLNGSATIAIQRADGTTVGFSTTTIGPNGSTFVDSVTLPSDGGYSVFANPSGLATGSISLTVHDVPADVADTIAPSATGDTKTVVNTVPGQDATLTFSGSPGQRIALRPTPQSYTPASSARVSVINPDGTTLVTPRTDSFIEGITLGQSGTYMILVNPQGASTGSLTLTAWEVGPDPTEHVTPTSAGVTQTVTTSVPSQNGKVTFDATPGQRVFVYVESETYSGSPSLWLKNPDGTNHTFITNVAAAGSFSNTMTLGTAGKYTLLIDPNGSEVGSMTVTLWDVPPDATSEITPTAQGAAVMATTTVPGQNARLTWSAAAGQRVSYNVTSKSFTDWAHLSVLRPDGTTLFTTGNVTSLPNYTDTITLPAAGAYTLLVDPRSRSVGTVGVTVYDVPSDLSDTIAFTPEGETKAVATATPGQNGRLTFSGTQGQKASLRVNSTTYPSARFSLQKPDGTNLISPTPTSGPFTFPTQTLPATGTYTILVDPTNAATGSMSLTLTDVSGSGLAASAAGRSFSTRVGQSLPAPTSGGSSLVGDVLRSDGRGLEGARVSVRGGPHATTDETGRFVLPGVRPGRNALLVDARNAAAPGSYGRFELIASAKRGRRTKLANPIWMSHLRRAEAISRGSVLKTAFAPALEVRFPGSAEPRADFTVTAVPIDRPPFPLPSRAKHPSYFSVQTERGRLPRDAQVVYPNLARLGAGARMVLWSYNARRGGWYVYGHGRVSQDRSRVLPGPNARVRDASVLVASVSRKQPRARRAKADRAETRRMDQARRGAQPAHRSGKRAATPRAIGPATRRPASRRTRSATEGTQRAIRLPSRRSRYAEGWRPAKRNRAGNWDSMRTPTPWAKLAPKQAPSGISALAGQALKLNGLPLAGVTMELEGTDVSTRTDKTGRFLLADVPDGQHVLVIDGRSAGERGQYGLFEAQVHVKRGKTTALEYSIWMPRLSRTGRVEIDSPTTDAVTVKTPHIPGLEVRVPKGSYVRDRNGKPVHELSITPIPTDRTPFPLPPHVEVPIYFTVQPGGAYLSKGAQIVYPNYTNLPPGQRVDFMQYDPDQRGWHVYGRGTVTPNGEQVMPDPDVRVWELTGAMITNTPTPPSIWPFTWLEGGKSDGDPVDLSSGLFTLKTTDLHVNDVVPLELTRTYRPNDANSYAFGIGMTNAYDMRLWTPVYPSYQEADLIMPDGGRVHYNRITPGTGFVDAIYESTTSAGRFYKSKVTWNHVGWELRLRDGTVYEIGDEAPLQGIRDRFGNRIEITRRDQNALGSGIGPITQITSTNGRWIKLNYDTSNRITSAVDNGGRRVEYTYNTGGRLATMKNAKGGITNYGYDKNGRMTTIKDPRATTYLTNTYDANGRVSKQTLADGGVFTYAYTLNAAGRVTKTRVTDPMARIREVTFGATSYPVTEARAVGTPIEQNTTYEREAGTNLLKSVTDELGRKTAYQHDALGNVTQVTRLAGTPDAKTTSFTYEPVENQIASVTDPLLHTTTFGYDSFGRVTTIEDATDRTVTWGYTNNDSRPDSVTDAAGKTATFDYFAGDLVATTDPLGNTTRHFVDNVGRPIVVTDPTGRKTTRRYDDVNQVTKVIDPAGQTTLFEHDANGNLTKVTDVRGKIRSFTYSTMNRRLTEVDPLNRTETYVYDKNGNLTKQTDRKGQITTLQYDALDRLTFAGYGTTGTTPTYASTAGYTYDGANRLTGVNDSVAGISSNVYDGLDRLTSQTTPVAAVGYGYDAAGRRTSMTVPGQAPVTYGFDDADRPLSIAQGGSSVAFGYDAAGRRGSVTLPNGVSQEYAYDNASRLTGTTYRRGATILGDLNYGLDAAGRRTAIWGSYARTGVPAPMNSATYDNANQRTVQDGAILTYDANGNLTKDASAATFTWNARDQLASTTRGATSASFVYDGTGRRQRKTINGQATDFVYDGANVVQERRGGAVHADLLTGGLDETFRRTTAAGSSDLLTDGLGSTLALSDPFGLPTTSYTYDPFGGTTQQGGASDNPFQYTGRENDGTGLQFNRNRYYSPGMGRFISPDPIGLGGGDANLYSYVGNNPMSATDPLGLYMEINDHLIITPGGPHIIKPYPWMSPLNQVFSGPFAPPLVGWDSYRQTCAWSSGTLKNPLGASIGLEADDGPGPLPNGSVGIGYSAGAWGGTREGDCSASRDAIEIGAPRWDICVNWCIGDGSGQSAEGGLGYNFNLVDINVSPVDLVDGLF
jgi:RHS repeat-associated protein